MTKTEDVKPQTMTLLQKIDEIDQKWSAIGHKANYGLANYIILIFAVTFNTPFVIVIPSTYIYWRAAYGVREVMHYILLQLIGVIITLSLKKYFRRPRPVLEKFVKLIGNKTSSLRMREKNNSMPSGDSMQVALFATFCFLNFNESFWFLIVPITMYGRVHFLCHFIADTIVGAAIGIFVAFTCNQYLELFVQFFF